MSDLVSGFGLTEEEAKVALQCCADDEIECKRRLTDEKEFIDIVRDTMYTEKLSAMKKPTRRKTRMLAFEPSVC